MASRLFWLVIILLGFGLIVLSSASVVEAAKDTGAAGYYWQHQLLYGILPGLILLLALRRVDYRKLRPLALPVLFVALVLMGLIFVPQLGQRYGGATSWLDIGPFTFQPAEGLKLALIMYLAAWLGGRGDRLKHWQLGLMPFVVVMGLITILLVLQPDFGTLGITILIAGGMYFVAGAPLRQTLVILASLVVLVGAAALFLPEQWSRVTTMFNPSADVRGEGWQLHQSLIAIGSGGTWGVGLGQSTQKFGFLPEPIGDSIFAVLVEEFGFAGGLFTVILFVALAIMLVGVARRAHDRFGALLASGMCLWITIQAFVNMAAVTGIGPLTGIPLPFISYGGTSLAAMLAGIGIVLNVAERGT